MTREPDIDNDNSELEKVLYECFRHFYHNDHANAAFHMAPVRYSPITFRLAEQINFLAPVDKDVYSEVFSVLLDLGQYEEDKGR